MRLIDADAIEWGEQLVPYGNGKYEYMRIAYMDDIDDLPTVEPEPHWISVKDRLPEVWDYVLCSQINGDVGEGKLLDDGYWHICYDQSHRRKTWVVAWQPLPEPFKEGEE